jgi:putative DNA-invertase from lambdoid prophage Rac
MVPRSSGTSRRKAVVYIRVSTTDQHTDNQRPELLQLAHARGFEVAEVIEEKISAAKKRPGFEKVMTLAHRGKVNAVIVYAIDRIGRSMVQNLQVVLELDRLGIEVISSREQWLQTHGPARSLLIGVMSWVAEQEKLRIRERTLAGLDRARREGKTLGRPPVEVDADKALLLRRRGLSLRRAAKKLGVSHMTLHRFFKSYDDEHGGVTES